MTSRISARPRRTRLYNTAYDIGESYYKNALDNLDRKKYAKPDIKTPLTTSLPKPLDINNTFDEDLQNYRARAHRAITEDPIFDSKGSRVNRNIRFQSAYGDDDLDEDIQDSLNRIRSNRKNLNSLMNDLDLDDSFSTIKRRGNLKLGEKLMSIGGDDEFGTSIKSRGLKMITTGADMNDDFEPGFKSRTLNLKSRLGDIDDSSKYDSSALGSTSKIVSSIKKRTLISSEVDDSAISSSTSAAAMRAKASKARLADLESDMFDRSEKQLEREKRSLHLKQLLADNDIAEVKSNRKVQF